ncbi:MAG: anaerobic ribonucleoside-triphosphate reductase activating protein [Candidatus Methanomethyliaceae archaeon]|nr:anaerobic ribonucleoside-triphosphate reductase activating protein [Candidatus Methanomethyliaceae archaeon]
MKKKMAYIGEIAPLSLSDYFGEPACVIFFSGCNFNCGYCQNWKLKKSSNEHLTDIESIKKVISENKLVTACKVTGGEPLLQLDALLEIGRFAKSIGLKFGIDTNGSLPEALAKILHLLDLVSIDIKADLDEESYRRVIGLQSPPVSEVIKSIEIAMRSDAYVEFRMVVIPGYNDSTKTMKSVSETLRALGYEEKASKGKACFNLIEFVPENAFDEDFRGIKNPSVSLLHDLAVSSGLKNARITHRGLGILKPVY